MEKDTFLKLYQLTSELWNERKGLDWSRNDKGRERKINKLEKMVKDIQSLDWDTEFKFLKEFYLKQ